MYKVYYNGSLIHDPSLMSSDYILLNGKCSKEAGKVDTMDFTILPSHPFYNVFTKLQTGIVAYRDNVEIFRGRILSSTINMNGEKSVQCEGSLAYLLDSIQPITKVDGTVSCANLFRTIIANHNNQVEAAKQFQVGVISAAKASDQIEVNQTSYTETRSMIDSYLLNPKGGYLRARFENGVQYIDWIEDFGRNPNQPFIIGANIVEMSEENSTDDFYTILLPLGKEEAEEKETREEIEEDESRDHTVFVSDVNGGSPYMPVSNEFVQAYGRIYHMEDYGTVSSPAELKSMAEDTLTQFRKKLNRTVEITGLDLHFLDPNYDQILIGDRVNIIAPNFNKNETLMATKIDYDFSKPQGDRYSFGDGILPLTRKTETGISTTKKTAEKARDNSLTNGRDLLIKKNLIDIEANKLNLKVNDAMNITAKYVKWTFDAMAFGGKSYSYSPADRQRIRGELADRWTDITRTMEGYISPEQGLADFKAISDIVTNTAEQVNTIYMHLDSDQGLFQWGVESKNLAGLGNKVNNVELVLNGPDGTGGLVSQVHEIDETGKQQGRLLKEAGIYVNPDTGAWLFNTDYTTGLGSVIKAESDKTSMVVTTNPDGTYAVNVGEIVLAINEAGESVGKINANKVLLSAGSIDQPLDTYMLMQSGKIDIVVGTDSQGRYVVNPAAIVASINDQTGESQVKINADKVLMTTGGKSEDLDTYISAESGKIALVVGTDSHGNPVVNPASIIAAINEQTGESIQKINADKVIISSGGKTEELDTYISNEAGKIALVVGTDSHGNPVVNPASIVAAINDQTGESIQTINADKVVISAGGKTEGLDTYIRNQLGKIELVVNTDSQGKAAVNPASIVMAINDQTGQSQIKINADQIDIDGLVKKLDTRNIHASTLNTTSTIKAGGTISAPTFSITQGDETVSINSGIFDLFLTLSGNTYTLKKKLYNGSEFEVGTFSRATTLARSWSGGIVTITATPQGSKLKMGIYDPKTDELTWNGNKVSFEVKTNLDDNEARYGTGKTITIDAQSIYDKGKKDGSESTTIGGSWSGGILTVTSRPQGNTLKSGIFDVAVSDITWNGNKASFPLYANIDNGETRLPTGKTITIDAQSIYDKGKADGSPTTLSRTWSGGTVTVTASPQGKNLKMGIYDLRSGDITWNGNKASLKVYTNLDGNEQYYDTGKVLTVDAQSIYNKGKTDGSKTTLSRAWSNGTITVTASPQGNTLKCSIYDPTSNELTWNGNKASFEVKTNLDGNETRYGTGKTITIDAQARYDAGYTKGKNDGKLAMGLSIDYGDGNSISVAEGSTRVAYVQAAASISYNSQTHKYTATGKAQVAPSGGGYTDMDSATATSGTQAYDAGVSAGYGTARLSLNTANHTVNIGNTGNLVSAAVQATGSVGEFDGADAGYPVTVKALVNGVEMNTGTIWVACEPEGSYSSGWNDGYNDGLKVGDYSTVYNAGYQAGLEAGQSSSEGAVYTKVSNAKYNLMRYATKKVQLWYSDAEGGTFWKAAGGPQYWFYHTTSSAFNDLYEKTTQQ